MKRKTENRNRFSYDRDNNILVIDFTVQHITKIVYVNDEAPW